jgi:hypothetical protein
VAMPNNFDELRQRITIREILEDHGISVTGKRIACPIHDGENKTSFSFTDSAFYCFSCGRKGGLVDLVMCLRDCDWNEALEYLENRTGLKLASNEPLGNRPQMKRKPLKRSAKLDTLRIDLDIINTLRDAYTRLIQLWRSTVLRGKASLGRYYAKIQIYEHELESLDERAITLIYQIHRLERGMDQ